MKFALVELKYVPRKFFIVPTSWIKDFKNKYSTTYSYFCFISTDLSEEPNFLANYSEKYDGLSGVFKVFIRKITDSLEAAILYQKEKRINSVPKKFRVPQNTDSELNAEEKKRKRNEKRTQKIDKENAAMKNSSHLTELVKSTSISLEYEKIVDEVVEFSDCNSAEEVTKKKNELLPGCILNQEADGERQSSLATGTIEKSIIREATKPSQIKVSTAGSTNKVYSHSFSTNNYEMGQNQSGVFNSNGKDKYQTDDIVLNTANKTCPSSSSVINNNKNEKNQPIVINPKRKDQNLSLVSAASKPFQTNVALNTANKLLPSSTSVINAKQKNRPIVVYPKQKGNTTIKQFQTNVVASDSAYGTFPSSFSVTDENENNQPNVGNPKQKWHSPSTVSTATKPFRSVALDAASKTCTSSSSIINKNQQYQASSNPKHDGQNKLSVTKIFRAETVAHGAANTSSATYPTKGNVKRQAYSSENCTGKKQKVASVRDISISNTEEIVPLTEQCTIIKKLEEENSQLKLNNEILTERNTALQIAIVICTKSIPPPLDFEEMDGGRLYNCGVFLNAIQCKVLDAITDDRQYCNAFILAVFGSETLKASSVKGLVSNRTKAPAKPALDPIRLKFIYDMMAIRTHNSILYNPYEVNKIINKKISNLLAGEREPKRPRKTKADQTLRKAIECDEDDDYNDENSEEEQNEEEDEEVSVEENAEEEKNEEEDEEISADENAEEERNEEEDETYKQDEPREECNKLNYEQVNGTGDVIHEFIESAENIKVVNEADNNSYFILDMPDLTEMLNYSFGEINDIQ